jgi:hypothetical protein
MMKAKEWFRMKLMVLILLSSQLGFACGSEEEPNLQELYGGDYALTETFSSHVGTHCQIPPAGAVANQVSVRIDDHKRIRFRFTTRWGELNGDMDGATYRASAHLGPDRNYVFSGHFIPDGLTGTLKDQRPDCKRSFTLAGTKGK